jgi:C4-dicarboxylate transporter DctM subunit
LTLLLFFLSFLVMMFLRVPIAISLGMASLFYLILSGTAPLLSITAPRMFAGMDNFSMLAIPLFVLSGDLLFSGKCSKMLINLANSMVGSFKGGLSTVTTVGCMLFGAVSGSGAATASAIGSVVAPEAEESGYDKTFIAAVITAAGPLGILIPPSIPMIVYGACTNTSIGALLLSGIGPGLLFGGLIIAYSYWVARKRGYGGVLEFKLSNVVKSFKDAFWALLTPLIIVGGIYTGVFTPTEAAAVAALWSLIVGLFIYRTLKFKDLFDIFLRSSITSGTIMFVVGGVTLFGWVLTREMIPQALAKFMLANVGTPLAFLFVANAVILVAGMLMDPSPAIILFAPLLLPIVMAMNIDPVFFGALMVTNLAIGLATPPVALTLYVACRICNVSLASLVKEVMPFIVLLVIGLFVLTLFPQIAMYIPDLLMK